MESGDRSARDRALTRGNPPAGPPQVPSQNKAGVQQSHIYTTLWLPPCSFEDYQSSRFLKKFGTPSVARGPSSCGVLGAHSKAKWWTCLEGQDDRLEPAAPFI